MCSENTFPEVWSSWGKKKKKIHQFSEKFFKPIELTKLIGCVTEVGQ